MRFSSREDEDLFFFLVLLYLSIGEKRNHFKVKQKCIVRLSFAQVLTINYYLSILFWKIFSYLYYCWLLLCYLVVFNICFTFEIQIHILLLIKCILRLYVNKTFWKPTMIQNNIQIKFQHHSSETNRTRYILHIFALQCHLMEWNKRC